LATGTAKIFIKEWAINYIGREGEGDSLLNFKVFLIVLTLLNPNMRTKLPYHPPVLRRRD
jgi:hypothetical protein